MKNKLTETNFKSSAGGVGHLFNKLACLGAVILTCSSASAQNLFMSDGYSGINHDLGNIYKIGPDGVPRTFRSGLNGPLGLAFDRTGNLFVASFGGEILKYSPDGMHSIFASGLSDPEGLAFDGAGNLISSSKKSCAIRIAVLKNRAAQACPASVLVWSKCCERRTLGRATALPLLSLKRQNILLRSWSDRGEAAKFFHQVVELA